MSKKVKGILVLKGIYTQKQFDVFSGLFKNVVTMHVQGSNNPGVEFIELPKWVKLQKKDKGSEL